ncbi:nitrate reductase cytochrome c-type subunit [Anaerobacillus isosaccharinicus]|uniref:Nitrate reductase cytochrome c-type subunit n=1 Tax=Anaerobacillus isosaccharinicus TaxID=1532552 RepID=A0A1S2LDV3_9BACI|nr:nitrate reductase cytochrome c-type subunit [Anaerobacillus isosaccharinicus]MBA5585962.1 nitrate reductase cytochrome c-type subunit [Anaerobacillus isosaccharinicus]QOY35757.1 nitrate reductase cytochrome c-type subunit [Anaerobacillus isosaccharinicus]
MKSNNLLFSVGLVLLIASLFLGIVGCTDNSATGPKQEQPKQETPKQEEPAKEPAKTVNVPQLNQDRAEAATMVLISAPTLQPVDHAGRWDPKTKGASCLMCHEQAEAMGAREIPIDHFVDEDRAKGIFGPRYVCVTCHGLDTGETKAAFND